MTCSLTDALKGARISSVLGSAMMDKLKFNLTERFLFLEPHAAGSTGFVLKQDFLKAKFADLAAVTLLSSSRVNIRMPPQHCGSQL